MANQNYQRVENPNADGTIHVTLQNGKIGRRSFDYDPNNLSKGRWNDHETRQSDNKHNQITPKV